VQDARFYHPTFRLNRRGEMAPDYLSLWRWIGSKCNWEDWEVRGLTKRPPASMVGSSDGEVTVHCHRSFTVRLQPALI